MNFNDDQKQTLLSQHIQKEYKGNRTHFTTGESWMPKDEALIILSNNINNKLKTAAMSLKVNDLELAEMPPVSIKRR